MTTSERKALYLQLAGVVMHVVLGVCLVVLAWQAVMAEDSMGAKYVQDRFYTFVAVWWCWGKILERLN